MAKVKRWDRHDILGELRRRRMTLTKLAEINGRSPGGFRTIWTRPNRENEAIIAKFLDVKVEELFPDRYPKRTSTVLSHEYSEESTSGRKAA
ncbi:helix-turn-helix domain-containing protein [Agrobacterium tumefaciens]|uniref:helix-turn-helix domain-containing protein n=1 Tax=Agrobacterium tumefaciens complex TaxID=1183400 RepID=UPI001FA957DB|nr:helix-turn-helix transcriptional regulator [Agrobacterium tumefaciens]UNZ49467.1 helix-turn-helix domain-containing protein [Agrobacterium tumefaciens]